MTLSNCHMKTYRKFTYYTRSVMQWQQPWWPTLKTNLDDQPWWPALTINLCDQPWWLTLTTNLDNQPWRPILTTNLDDQSWRSALTTNLDDQLWQPTLTTSLDDQLNDQPPQSWPCFKSLLTLYQIFVKSEKKTPMTEQLSNMDPRDASASKKQV